MEKRYIIDRGISNRRKVVDKTVENLLRKKRTPSNRRIAIRRKVLRRKRNVTIQ